MLYILRIYRSNNLIKMYLAIILAWASQKAGLETMVYVLLFIKEYNPGEKAWTKNRWGG